MYMMHLRLRRNGLANSEKLVVSSDCVFSKPQTFKVRAVFPVGTVKCRCYKSIGRISSPCSIHTFMIYYILMMSTFKEVKDMVRFIFEIVVFHFSVGHTFFLSLRQIASFPQGFSIASSFKTNLCWAKRPSKDFILVFMYTGPFLHRALGLASLLKDGSSTPGRKPRKHPQPSLQQD